MNHTRPLLRFLLAALLLLPLLPSLPAAAAEIDCEQMLAATAAKKFDKPTIKVAQERLALLGYDPGEIDGWLGPNTRGALLRFCTDEKFARTPDLLATLREHVTIFQAYKNWLTTLASDDFQKWAAQQADAADIERIRRSGNAAEVIAVLSRFDKRKAAAARPAKLRSDAEAPVSYHLTKDDLAQLKTREVLSVRVGKLLDKAYGDEGEFETAADSVLKNAADSDEYLHLAKKYGVQQTGYTLTDASLADLKTADVPDYVLDALQKIKDLNYADGDLDTTVTSQLGALSAEAMGFKQEFVKLAEVTPTGGSLTDAALQKFTAAHQGDLLAAATAEQVAQIKGVKYKDDAALAAAVQKILTDIATQIESYRGLIVQAAEESSSYLIDKAQAREIPKMIKDSAVPEIFLTMLAGMQDVDYPDANLFWLATKSRVEMSAPKDPFKVSIRSVIERNNANKIDAALMAKFKEAKLPPSILDQLESLQGREFANTEALEHEISRMFRQLGAEYDRYRVLILAQAQKRHAFDPTRHIQWSGNGCNCVDHALYGSVYGFYPYWMAGGSQAVDFSVQSRIGYYGLTFDNQGNVTEPARWSAVNTAFLSEARRFGTKVDLVIYKKDWKGWSDVADEDKASLFKKLAADIATLVKLPMTDLFSKVKPVVSMGAAPPPIMGDGVTLYFAEYPRDPASVTAFRNFILALHDELAAQRRSLSINIVFRSEEIGKGIYDYQNLLDLKDAIEKSNGAQSPGLKTLFLLLLQEPTANDEKKVRRFIEHGLTGEKLVRLLRSIVTVVTYDGHSESQLTDDVLYAKDNFGGIGFWTLPVAVQGKDAPADAAAAAGAALSADKVLAGAYVNAKESDTPAQAAVCGVVCPNRWAFRISWDVFVIALLTSAVLYVTACECRSFFASNFVLFLAGVVAPFLALTFALLFCDPSWRQISRGNGILILVTAAGLAYAIWSYLEKKRSADLP
ncbi:MAG TPA: peptidoglycan-binding domain-containing protein [Burkholderiaceae bacterium]